MSSGSDRPSNTLQWALVYGDCLLCSGAAPVTRAVFRYTTWAKRAGIWNQVALLAFRKACRDPSAGHQHPELPHADPFSASSHFCRACRFPWARLPAVCITHTPLSQLDHSSSASNRPWVTLTSRPLASTQFLHAALCTHVSQAWKHQAALSPTRPKTNPGTGQAQMCSRHKQPQPHNRSP